MSPFLARTKNDPMEQQKPRYEMGGLGPPPGGQMVEPGSAPPPPTDPGSSPFLASQDQFAGLHSTLGSQPQQPQQGGGQAQQQPMPQPNRGSMGPLQGTMGAPMGQPAMQPPQPVGGMQPQPQQIQRQQPQQRRSYYGE